MSCSVSRVALGERLPLKEPFSLHVYPSFYCNFKCNYCLHSLDANTLLQKGFRRQYMDFSTFQKAVDDVVAQGWRLKAMIFAGHGEPLLHPRIADMVAYAKEKDIADRVEIVTNGSLLTHGLSDALIAAGLDRLRVSLQGVSEEAYRETSGVSIRFDRFVEQLDYFYRRKTSTDVYIKIIDVALKLPGDREKFEAIFRPVANTVAVEYAIPFVPEIDLGRLSGNSKQGCDIHASVCSMPFYMLVLYPNGDVLPCCSTEIPEVFGNIGRQSLGDIWSSQARTEFLLRQLDGVSSIPVCSACSVPAFGLQEGDSLEGYQERLKPVYRCMLNQGRTDRLEHVEVVHTGFGKASLTGDCPRCGARNTWKNQDVFRSLGNIVCKSCGAAMNVIPADYVDTQSEENYQKLRGHKIALWPMTNAVTEFLDITPSAFGENTFLIDSSKTKQGALYRGKIVYPPSIIDEEQIDTVFVSVTTSIATEIIDELKNKHPSVKHILFLGDVISNHFQEMVE